MNDAYIVTTYCVIDDILKAYGYQDDCRAQGSAAYPRRAAVNKGLTLTAVAPRV